MGAGMSNITDFSGGKGAEPWVSGATYAVGKTVLSPANDYQPFVRIVAGAGTTDPSADGTNWKPIGGRAIKSIQRGVISMPDGGSGGTISHTATVTSVNTSKADLTYLGNNSSGTGANSLAYLQLTNSTTITATRATSGSATAVSWQLVEYY